MAWGNFIQRSHLGVYYFRYSLPKRILIQLPGLSKEIKFSLKTTDKKTAISLARRLWIGIESEIRKTEMAFDISEGKPAKTKTELEADFKQFINSRKNHLLSSLTPVKRENVTNSDITDDSHTWNMVFLSNDASSKFLKEWQDNRNQVFKYLDEIVDYCPPELPFPSFKEIIDWDELKKVLQEGPIPHDLLKKHLAKRLREKGRDKPSLIHFC